MELRNANDIIAELNAIGEHEQLEAKSLKEDSLKSLMETVCSFSNEPGLGGGIIILGVAEKEGEDGVKTYFADGIDDIDRAQLDIATQCKEIFNVPVVPRMRPDRLDGKKVLVVSIPEADAEVKPVYFRAKGVPLGGYRRVGSSDLVCTDEDLQLFYELKSEGYDSRPVKGARISDVDPDALKKYRELRSKVNAAAEELSYSDAELLESLHCTCDDDPSQLNVAGVLLFGNRKLLRRCFPMARIDCIRVPTLEWVENPDESFETVDMRGPLVTLVSRVLNAVNDDLPKGFVASKTGVQAGVSGLPLAVLREAIVNALMHASYRLGSPIQIIRYPNRIEIRNPGYSLKAPERFSQPGSFPRNKIIAPVFHDTNLAETKGSGFRRMEKLLQAAHLAPPTTDSDRVGNSFSLILLLHHLLDEDDTKWLTLFNDFDLTDNQKLALVFVRQVSAIDNRSYRKNTGLDTLQASHDFIRLRDLGLLDQRGQGVRTYYRPGKIMIERSIGFGAGSIGFGAGSIGFGAGSIGFGAGSIGLGPLQVTARVERLRDNEVVRAVLGQVSKHMKRANLKDVLIKLCRVRPLMRQELALLLSRNQSYLWGIIKEMIEVDKTLKFTRPEMPNHPEQAYEAVEKRK